MMTAGEAIEKVHDTRRVEEAYRVQALQAQRAYASVAGLDPYSDRAMNLDKLRREALAQWTKAQRDRDAAYQGWRRVYGRTVTDRRAAGL